LKTLQQFGIVLVRIYFGNSHGSSDNYIIFRAVIEKKFLNRYCLLFLSVFLLSVIIA